MCRIIVCIYYNDFVSCTGSNQVEPCLFAATAGSMMIRYNLTIPAPQERFSQPATGQVLGECSIMWCHSSWWQPVIIWHWPILTFEWLNFDWMNLHYGGANEMTVIVKQCLAPYHWWYLYSLLAHNKLV